ARVRKVTPDGIIHTVAGGGTSLADGVAATTYRLGFPVRIRVDSAGNLYVVNVSDDNKDISRNRILKVDTRGIISTVVGGGVTLSDGVPGPSLAVLPSAIALDSSGNVYFTDGFTYKVRKVDAGGKISSIAGSGKEGFSGDNGPALNATFS